MPRVRSTTDLILLYIIASFQLAISSLLLAIQFVAYGGGFQPVSTPFRLFGFVNALFLFTARPVPRLGSLLWQLIFLTWILGLFSTHPAAQSGSDSLFALVVSWLMLMSLIYLAASLRQEFAQRGWSWSAWMDWK